MLVNAFQIIIIQCHRLLFILAKQEEGNTPEKPHTVIQFSYQSNAQMNSILKKTAARCPEIAMTYSIGRSVEGKDLLVIEFSNNPGVHELREY